MDSRSVTTEPLASPEHGHEHEHGEQSSSIGIKDSQ